jgi:hypothetical protein
MPERLISALFSAMPCTNDMFQMSQIPPYMSKGIDRSIQSIPIVCTSGPKQLLLAWNLLSRSLSPF